MVATDAGLAALVSGVASFSPLFVGAMVATSIDRDILDSIAHFQSPFRRGNGCYFDVSPFQSCLWFVSFSPLFVGAMVATLMYHRFNHVCGLCLSVPFSSGQWLLPP